MKTYDDICSFLCNEQGNIFEESIKYSNISSAVFVRRFMYSNLAIRMDEMFYMFESESKDAYIQEIMKEYDVSAYGKVFFGSEVLFWMGYLYRYFSYTRELSSKRVFEIIPANELARHYYAYHSLSIESAIERIIESKEIDLKTSLKFA